MSIKYTSIPIDKKDLDPKILFFLDNQHKFDRKSVLFDLFTITSKPLLTLPDHVLGKDVIKIEAEHLYDLMDYVDSFMFFVAKTNPDKSKMTKLTIPKDTATVLSKYDKFYYPAIGGDRTLFKVGQIITTPWDTNYTVQEIRKYRNVNQVPNDVVFEGVLGDDIKDRPFNVLYLEKTTEVSPAVSPSKDYDIYGSFHLAASDVNNDRSPATLILVKLGDGDTAPFHIFDKFPLSAGVIENYKDKEQIITTCGLFLANRLVLVGAFGDKIPYINSKPGSSDFTTSKIDDIVANLILNGVCGRKEYDKYMQLGYFLGSMTAIGVPGLSRKALSTDPRVAKRRAELLELHKDELDDPIVYTKIEKELIDMDKAWLKGDSSERFYAVSAKKSYNEHRKKMYLTMGISLAFSGGATQYVTTPGSLADGWDIQHLPTIANEIRRGSYDRGKGTAKGGEQTELILRVLNAVRITDKNCNSNKGITLELTEKNGKEYLGRYVVVSPGKYDMLTKENLSKYVGKTVTLRSPMYCNTIGGLCYTCAGEYFSKLDTEAIGILGVMIGSKFTSISMKSMHFSGISSTTVKDINDYIIPM